MVIQMDRNDKNQFINEDEEYEVIESDEEFNDIEDTESDGQFYTTPTVEYAGKEFKHYTWCGLFSPGSAYIMQGRASAGIIINTLFSQFLPIGCLVCLLMDWFPAPLLLCLMAVILLSWIHGIVQYCERKDSIHLRTPAHPIGLLGIAFLTFWLPFIFESYISSNLLYSSKWMGNDTMLPGIEKGDVILVDGLSHRYRQPEYGDLVLVEELVGGEDNENNQSRAFLGRIIACSGDEVQLLGVHPKVNKKKLIHYYERVREGMIESSGLVYELPFKTKVPKDIQVEPKRWYAVSAPEQVIFSQTNSVKLDPEYFYVLEDNRNFDLNKQSYGSIVHRSQIRGFPKYVLYNTEQSSHFSRFGMRLR